MLTLVSGNAIDDIPPVSVPPETDRDAEGRVLMAEVERVKRDCHNRDCMILADAILHLSAIVYGADPPL